MVRDGIGVSAGRDGIIFRFRSHRMSEYVAFSTIEAGEPDR